MTDFRQAVYLSDSDEPLYRVRCPIHGFIHFSRNERQIIDHPLFQRLRHIRQLALTELVYPGATHTRFEHSLGVMEVATLGFDRLATKHGRLLEDTFQTLDDLHSEPIARPRQLLRLAALLHDVGHAAFSHAVEDVVNKGVGHEALTLHFVNTELAPILDALWGQGTAQRVAQIIDGPKSQLPLQLAILHDLVSGVMDADRTDYLRRDSYHCGVDYGRFDHRRLIESLEIQGAAPRLELALHRDGLHAFEGLIIARYQMSTQVYYHRLRRLYDLYLTKYHHALGVAEFDSPEKLSRQNDVTMMARIMADAEHGTGERSMWARRIRERRHHRIVFETGVNADARALRHSKRVFDELKACYTTCDLLADSLSKRIHDLEVPGDPDPGQELTLVGRDGTRRLVTQESQILATIPRKFQVFRIFCDVAHGDGNARLEISRTATNRFRELQQGGTQ